MTLQVTTKLARLGARLEAIGRRHANLESRIEAVNNRPQPNMVALQRLKREQQRLVQEMQCYEGLLRSLTRTLSGNRAVAVS